MRLLTAVVVLLGAYTSNVGAGFLEIEDLQVGEGIEVANGDQVTVHYTGWLIDGTKFDSSLDRGKPFTFELGARQVIQGWDRGVRGMQVGGIRKLTIPPELAYGDRAVGGGLIPANSTLVFEVKLLEITR
ncbi:MAG: FKBP-type peptidyl-prolyl cis-trans isomerase [Alphaproteobacteria bacterium]|jgi:FKBP-type peptidyl-prolyl cis-trans isomerase|nr:MAG: FK506-binding protein [Alphaproteobacteria bacterium MarineAlpha9_Bin6]PPR40163.1 MAG: FK506-binding protein [Alphaproteobacteria bacterium MarineAlpha9_Bin5]HHZ67803.1 FKBP-type peptidyl-prolyl cis-trans isomerase [Alphaproteobacteria bacterium]HIA22333.1 FKBP-type peptidyl-prolyl cis-trans isomerase [Alphaproteobacteria bacterium]HIB17725.1 FKBP-type peptidyl-prolyl cis-trans isomerase [Alphaproteobacteria bacterium]